MRSKPPTAVKPEIALVTDIKGLCRAGVTPHTVWYPTTLASPNLVTMELKMGPGEPAPNAMTAPKPPVVTRALFRVGLYRSTGPTGTSFFFSCLGGGAGACSRSASSQGSSSRSRQGSSQGLQLSHDSGGLLALEMVSLVLFSPPIA